MPVPHERQRPRNQSHEATGTLSYHASSCPQLMQADPGENYSVARLQPEVLADMRARLERARAKYEPMADLFPPHVAPASAADHPD